jgi:hypothetical protein
MKIFKREYKMCPFCGEKHEILTISEVESICYKGKDFSFGVVYEYCPATDAYIETEELIRRNMHSMVLTYQRQTLWDALQSTQRNW